MNSIYAKPEKVQYKKVADTRIMHNMEMDWNALSEFNHLFAKVKSKSQIAITLKLFFAFEGAFLYELQGFGSGKITYALH